jgi:hypothetical protein
MNVVTMASLRETGTDAKNSRPQRWQASAVGKRNLAGRIARRTVLAYAGATQ